MQSFFIALNAVLPFMVYMGYGAILRKTGIIEEATLNKLTAFAFRALFPFLMFKNVYWADAAQNVNVGFVAYAILSVGLVLAASCWLIPRWLPENPRRASVIQAIYRSNLALFAIPLGESIYGLESTLLSAMIVAFVVPLYNLSATVLLEHYRGGKSSPPAMIKKILSNPLIIGIVTGAVFKLLHIPIPATLEKPIRALGDSVTPLALVALGGTLRFSSLKRNWNVLWPVTLLRMVALPIVSYAITLALGFGPAERFMLLLLFATPVATSSYPMAQAMGADGTLAGEFVVVSHTLSLLTLFGFVFGLSRMGLL